MGLDCHAMAPDGGVAIDDDRVDTIFDVTSMALIGMQPGHKSSFSLRCYTRFILEATEFDIHGHNDYRLRADDIDDLLDRMRKCDASAHGRWLHDDKDPGAVLGDLITYFELCQTHGLEVLLL